MSDTSGPNPAKRVVSSTLRHLAQLYVRIHKPTVVAVGGSIGKTSTKLMLAKVLESEKKVSYMDDSYNTGIGLYLSVFRLKVPRHSTILGWAGKVLQACMRLFTTHPEIVILEYGIDGEGDMDELLGFIRPDVSILTAVTPEHMEFLKTIDIVGAEETKILKSARQFGVVNAVDVDEKYLQDISVPLLRYGNLANEASYTVQGWTASGTTVSFAIDGAVIDAASLRIVSEPLIRQLSGVLLVASRLGVSHEALARTLPEIRAAAGRMCLLEAVKESMVIDDTANFSPVAGVAALQTLKRMSATRRIAVLGNMHELGEFAREGYEQVANEFNGVDIIVLIGDLATEWFKPLAQAAGFIEGTTLFTKATSLEAGMWLRDEFLQSGDLTVVKGPFGGWYLEEVTRLILRNAQDVQYVTRQAPFWHTKKTKHFGDAYSRSFEQHP